MKKEEIIKQLQSVADDFVSSCSAIPEELFFNQPAAKWSIAQNITHLTTASNMTRLAYQLPKLIVRLYGGRPNRDSRTFEQLVSKYKLKLEEGGKASGPYVPKPVPKETGKQKIIQQFAKSMHKLIRAFRKNWKEEQLDQYLAPHPLLGRITLRELGYFTIYHTLHHDRIIKERLNP